MTREHIRRLVEHNRGHGDQTKQAVLNIVRQIGEPISPHEIKNILYSTILSKLIPQYEGGKINRNEFHKKLKDRTIDIRTVHRKLSALVEEGVLKKEHGTYELTPKAKSDIRYFAREFGHDLLSELMCEYVPGEHSIGENVDYMVRLFGVYILFCFMETSRPLGSEEKLSGTLGPTKDRLIFSCLQNIIRVDEMFDYFLSTTDYLLSDNTTKKTKYHMDKIYSRLPEYHRLRNDAYQEGRPPSALELELMRSMHVSDIAKPIRLAAERNLNELEKKKGRLTYAERDNYLPPDFDSETDIDKDKLEVLEKALSRAYPDIYKRLANMVSASKENPKQKLTDLRDTWQPLF
ncbi:hypothetical protein BH18THE2_BH18THE2_26510 [soil metagenome]